MTLLEWRDEFRIGIEEVDHEHRELIALINAAHAHGVGADTVEAALGEIYAAITAHFALEEKDMRALNYPSLPAHKTDHESLLDDLRDIMEAVADGHAPPETEFGNRLSDWFAVHFRTHDALLHRFVAGLDPKGGLQP